MATCGRRRSNFAMSIVLQRFLLVGLVVCAVGAGGGAQAAPARLTVVATIFPVADLVRQVAGPDAEVLLLLPPGASPHTFEPTPDTMRALARSRIFFMVGAGLENWAGKLVSSAAPRDLTLVDLSQGVPLIIELESPESRAGRHLYGATLGLDSGSRPGREHREESHAGEANPHYWTDPLIALELVDRIEATLAAAVPGSRAAFAARAASLRARLRDLDEEIRRSVAGFRNRRLVTFHNSWPYFARRYGLDLAGVIEVAPGREPGPQHLSRIVAAIRVLKVPAIFAEPQLPARPAEVLARETGVKVLVLDPIGGVAPDRLGYVELMRFNLRSLEQGLKDRD